MPRCIQYFQQYGRLWGYFTSRDMGDTLVFWVFLWPCGFLPVVLALLRNMRQRTEIDSQESPTASHIWSEQNGVKDCCSARNEVNCGIHHLDIKPLALAGCSARDLRQRQLQGWRNRNNRVLYGEKNVEPEKKFLTLSRVLSLKLRKNDGQLW